jgi:hypothetical protein
MLKCKDCKNLMICSYTNRTHGHIFCIFNTNININNIEDCNQYEKEEK